MTDRGARIDGRLPVSIAIPQAVGLLAAFATAGGVRDWYPGLIKPPFTPPGWVFGPAWILLYLLMGIALWLVWRRLEQDAGVRTALVAFAAQLALNGLWSFLFFGLRMPGVALSEIVILWAAITVTATLFWRISKPAAVLLMPYWLWVGFASVLNASIWYLNR